ncbi:MAG: RNA polymerase sigma factor [Planctomycetota bacterium]
MNALVLRLPATTTPADPACPQAAEPGSIAALVPRVRSGDRHAAAALLRQMQARWYRFCLAQLRRPHDADDATQEVALRVLSKLPRLRQIERFETWSFGIAVNVCRESRRRSTRHRAADVAAAEPAAAASPDAASTTEDLAALHAALADLPPRQREAVTLRYLEGMTIADAAAAMRCRPGTIKAAVFNGLRTLRRRLAEDPR